MNVNYDDVTKHENNQMFIMRYIVWMIIDKLKVTQKCIPTLGGKIWLGRARKGKFLLQRSIDSETMVKYLCCYTAKKGVKETLLQKSNRKAMIRNWSNQKANPALKTKLSNPN